MASKESARSRGIAAQLEALRGVPPGVVLIVGGCGTEPANVVLLTKIRALSPSSHRLSPLIDDASSLSSTILKIGNVRYNKWGKFEVFLADKAKILTSMKASQDEIDKLCWRQFQAYGDDQIEALNELVSQYAVTGSAVGSAAIKLLDLAFLPDNAPGEVNAGAPIVRKQVVYGKWQLLKFVIPVSAPKLTSVSSTSLEVAASGEPPKKRAKKAAASSSSAPTTTTTIQEGPAPMGASDGKDQEECVQE